MNHDNSGSIRRRLRIVEFNWLYKNSDDPDSDTNILIDHNDGYMIRNQRINAVTQWERQTIYDVYWWTQCGEP